MIASLNQTGNLTRDPELKYTPSGKAFVKFTVASNTRRGENDLVAFVTWKAWEATAEFLCRNFRKGDTIQVIGDGETEKWTDKKTGEERSHLIFTAIKVGFIGGRSAIKAELDDQAGTPPPRSPLQAAPQPAPRPLVRPVARVTPDVIDDGADVPF